MIIILKDNKEIKCEIGDIMYVEESKNKTLITNNETSSARLLSKIDKIAYLNHEISTGKIERLIINDDEVVLSSDILKIMLQ